MKNTPTFLITGGTGFIGRKLVEALVKRNEYVRVLGRRPVVRWRGNDAIEHVRADITEPNVIEAAVDGVRCVFHLLAATSGDRNNYHRVTVEGSQRLLSAVRARGGGRVIFVSSLSVYDSRAMFNGVLVDENFPLDTNGAARGPYAYSKTKADLAAQQYLDDPLVKLTIVRPGVVYGERMKNPLNGAAISLRNRFWVSLGSRRRVLPLIFLRDLVNALLLVADDDASIGQIYNLIGAECPSGDEYISCYKKVSRDRRPHLNFPLRTFLPVFWTFDKLLYMAGRPSAFVSMANRLSQRVRYSAEKAQRELGVHAATKYDEGLREIWRQGA